MYGYVRPVEAELSREDRERYRAAYCGLCHAMGRQCGFPARLTLNYDFTLLAILFLPPEEPELRVRHCPAHPLKKQKSCAGCKGLELAADESVILAWQKLRDDVEDRDVLSGLPPRAAALGLKGAYRGAAARRPEFDRQVRECLSRLHALEQERSPSIDRTADTFAGILRSAVPRGLPQRRTRTLEQLLYHLGRWIYLVDAWDDLAEDRAAGRYNPLEVRFGGRPEEEADYVRTTLTHSVKLAISAFQLEDFGCWGPLIENILYRGLPSVQEAVLTGRWKELQKRREKADERSLQGTGPGAERQR